jgi:hypothetical protein
MLKRYLLLLLFGFTITTQWACAPLAAGVAGAVIGYEIAEDDDD